jgi:hypothetical protein
MEEIDMQKGLAAAFGIGVLISLSGGALAQPHPPLQYQGGPVLQNFEIYPLYFGAWSDADIGAHHEYLVDLAAYMSGDGAPPGQEPVLWQYTGSAIVTVAGAKTTNPGATPHALTNSELVTIISNAQAASPPKLPAYGLKRLLMVLPAHGFTLQGRPAGSAYHASNSPSQFWAVVPYDSGPNINVVTAHEVFEAATDPSDFNAPLGWIGTPLAKNPPEAVDGCNNPLSTYPFITLSFGQIPGAADNTQGGACSTTGYIPIAFGPVGVWPGTIVHLSVVAGPVTPPPGTPVEATLGFVDFAGNPVGEAVIVSLVAGQVVSLDLNASLLAKEQGQHADVHPVISASPGAVLPPLRATTEVFDTLTGFGAVLTTPNTAAAIGQAFGPQGLARGQTMRISAVAFAPNPCVAILGFADNRGAPVGPSLQVNLAPDRGATLDLNANTLGAQAAQRIELQPVLTLQNPVVGTSAHSACAASSEVFDSATGRTLTHQTIIARQ